MPRHAKGPRLYLRERKGRETVWVIRDRETERSTECGAGDIGGAEKALAEYIAEKHEPGLGERDPARLLLADIMNGYSQARAATPSAELIGYHMIPLLGFWGGDTLDCVKAERCKEYVTWRTKQNLRQATKNPRKVETGSARRELETLSAAINWYHAEFTLPAVPVVTLPEKAPARYQWLDRSQAAAALRDGRSHRKHGRHLMRFILIGVYTGSRHSTITSFRWIPSPNAGWFDVERGVFYRKGSKETETNKRRPPARIPARLLAHLRRWRRMDLEKGITHVIHYGGQPVKKVRKAFERTCERIDLTEGETPHVLRHTCATWAMQNKADPWELSGFLGMSLKMLMEVYGHHHPDHQASVSEAFTRRRRV